MERARLRTEQALNEVRADSDRFLSSLSDSRRRNIEAITNASGRVAQSIASTTSSADETQRAMAGLDQAVKDAADSVARINAEMRAGANTAEALYAELTRQFAICETNPDYFKFAPREFASVQERVASLAGKTSGSAAIEMVCANALNDILIMDVKVARGRAVYHMQHLEAVKTAEKIKADIRQARTSFFDDLPAQEGELIDMDYWTHGQYKAPKTKSTAFPTPSRPDAPTPPTPRPTCAATQNASPNSTASSSCSSFRPASSTTTRSTAWPRAKPVPTFCRKTTDSSLWAKASTMPTAARPTWCACAASSTAPR